MSGRTLRVTGTVTLDLELAWQDEPEPPPGDGFVLGVTEPTAEGAYTPAARCGPRIPETSMANYAGAFTNVADGETIGRIIISGPFRPEATGWVLRDTIIAGGQPDGEIFPLLDVRDGAIDAGVIEFTEVRPTHRGYRVYGYKGGNATLNRCVIRGVVDGCQPHGSGSYPDTRDKAARIRGT